MEPIRAIVVLLCIAEQIFTTCTSREVLEIVDVFGMDGGELSSSVGGVAE